MITIAGGGRQRARRSTVAAVRVLACTGVVLLGQLMAPAPASACDVSYGYKPTITFDLRDGPGLGSGECSTGTSLTGAAILAVLGVALLAAVLKRLLDRGASRAAALSPAETGVDSEQALSAYLDSAGLTHPPGPRESPT
jgi:hypothetical protein